MPAVPEDSHHAFGQARTALDCMEPPGPSDLISALQVVRERIAAAAERSGRHTSAVQLVAVTKGVSVSRIQEAYSAGLRDFGENYVQEVLPKQDQLPSDAKWHFIGHLQTNKVRQVVGRFILIQSVDTLKLAAELGKRSAASGLCQNVLLEVLLDEGGAKHGVPVGEALAFAEAVSRIEGLSVRGLMGMAPLTSDPEEARPHFRRLKRLFDSLPAENRQVLSMGMTGDFEVAVEEGSTMVRLGTALFGRRNG